MVTAAVAEPPFRLAVIVADPCELATTGKSANRAPAGMFTCGGTEAMDGLEEPAGGKRRRVRVVRARANGYHGTCVPIRAATMTTLEITLPDNLATEAKAAGLLAPEAVERMVREAIRQKAMGELKLAMERMAVVEGPVMTPQEIQEEIKAARAERRAREARAAGT